MDQSWHRYTGHKDDTAAPSLNNRSNILFHTHLNSGSGCRGNPSTLPFLFCQGKGTFPSNRSKKKTTQKQPKPQTQSPTVSPVKIDQTSAMLGRVNKKQGGKGLGVYSSVVSSVTHWRTTYMLFSQEAHDLKVNMPGYTGHVQQEVMQHSRNIETSDVFFFFVCFGQT